MSGYALYLSDGSLLTTINVKTVDVQRNSSLVLLGQGVPDYGAIIAQNFIWLLENFSRISAPDHPITGQFWYDLANDEMKYYSDNQWRQLFSISNDSPTLSSDAGTAILDSTATDTAGTVTIGDASTTCTLTFHNTRPTIPHVIISSPTGLPGLTYTVSTTAIVVSYTLATGLSFTYFVAN